MLGGKKSTLYSMQINFSNYTVNRGISIVQKYVFPTRNTLIKFYSNKFSLLQWVLRLTHSGKYQVWHSCSVYWEDWGLAAGWFFFFFRCLLTSLCLVPLAVRATDLHLSLERSRFSSTLLRRMLSNLTWFSRCSSFSSTLGLPRPPGLPLQ